MKTIYLVPLLSALTIMISPVLAQQTTAVPGAPDAAPECDARKLTCPTNTAWCVLTPWRKMFRVRNILSTGGHFGEHSEGCPHVARSIDSWW
jgi:hypothetical protein